MKYIYLVVFLLSGIVNYSVASQMYTCKKDNGQTTFSDKPCEPLPPAAPPPVVRPAEKYQSRYVVGSLYDLVDKIMHTPNDMPSVAKLIEQYPEIKSLMPNENKAIQLQRQFLHDTLFQPQAALILGWLKGSTFSEVLEYGTFVPPKTVGENMAALSCNTKPSNEKDKLILTLIKLQGVEEWVQGYSKAILQGYNEVFIGKNLNINNPAETRLIQGLMVGAYNAADKMIACSYLRMYQNASVEDIARYISYYKLPAANIYLKTKQGYSESIGYWLGREIGANALKYRL